jgi:flagellar operon protein
MPEINGINVPFVPAGGVERLNNTNAQKNKGIEGSSFNDIFAKELQSLKFSGHAQSRLISKNINLNEQDMIRLETAVEKAQSKQAKDSLVLMDDKAFIINIPNKIVVTMMSKDTMDENIITQIDSAVFA